MSVLRCACRAALRRPSASSFPRTALLQKTQQPSILPGSNITSSRRPYSSNHCVSDAYLDMQRARLLLEYEKHGMPLRKNKKLMTTEESILPKFEKKLDQQGLAFDKMLVSLKRLEELMREKIKRDRRRKVLVRGAIFAGLAIYAKKHFFGGSQEDKGITTESN